MAKQSQFFFSNVIISIPSPIPNSYVISEQYFCQHPFKHKVSIIGLWIKYRYDTLTKRIVNKMTGFFVLLVKCFMYFYLWRKKKIFGLLSLSTYNTKSMFTVTLETKTYKRIFFWYSLPLLPEINVPAISKRSFQSRLFSRHHGSHRGNLRQRQVAKLRRLPHLIG